MTTTKPPSMTDVARRAGVSQSTVSYVLSGTRPISGEVRARVEAAVRDLHYAPSAAAQALRGGSTNTLVLSMPDIEASRDGWLGLYMLRLTLAARNAGYDLLVTVESSNAADVLEQIARARRADGAMLLSVAAYDSRIDKAIELGFPTVALGEPVSGGLPFVDYDFRQAAGIAVAHLASRGHTTIAYVGPRQVELASGLLYVDRAITGFHDAARRHGVTLAEYYPVDDADDDRRGFATVLAATHPTALVVTGSFSSAERLRAEFLRVTDVDPRDVVEFGTSGLPDGREHPHVRVVNPIDTLASATVDTLVDVINGRGHVSRLVAPALLMPSTAAVS